MKYHPYAVILINQLKNIFSVHTAGDVGNFLLQVHTSHKFP